LRFIFGDHLIDAAGREPRRIIELIAVEPQVFDLLSHSLGNRDHVGSEDDLVASF
jgi:DNA-binding winged helix-turn-helix (wHTH) protein